MSFRASQRVISLFAASAHPPEVRQHAGGTGTPSSADVSGPKCLRQTPQSAELWALSKDQIWS